MSPALLRPPEAGVIEEARVRQRRQRGAAALIALALIVGSLAFYVATRHDGSHRGTGATAPTAGQAFATTPYMGVACGVPNWIGCDRVGLSVTLRRPARSVNATVAGSSFALRDPRWSGPTHDGRRRTFAGFLQPAGLVGRLGVKPLPGQRWLGAGTPEPLVTFTIAYGSARRETVRARVPLMAGWG
ncbi:MAG TPA: hypothetical protein VGG08_00285 [Solirubrobacteraceae bacterium]|jgi:hypothetical protein